VCCDGLKGLPDAIRTTCPGRSSSLRHAPRAVVAAPYRQETLGPDPPRVTRDLHRPQPRRCRGPLRVVAGTAASGYRPVTLGPYTGYVRRPQAKLVVDNFHAMRRGWATRHRRSRSGATRSEQSPNPPIRIAPVPRRKCRPNFVAVACQGPLIGAVRQERIHRPACELPAPERRPDALAGEGVDEPCSITTRKQSALVVPDPLAP
jgi:hypothetical protein